MEIMSNTNSNSITSIFVAEFNNNPNFKDAIVTLFKTKIKQNLKEHYEISENINRDSYTLNNKIELFNCSHSPLRYEEMKKTEIDIIARMQEEHKPKLMIEVKAGIKETLQKSQTKTSEYYKTAKAHGIPLLYIIPKNYHYIDDLPNGSIKITWEEIRKKIKDQNKEFCRQIDTFVEITDENTELGLKKEDDDYINTILDEINDSLGKMKNKSRQKDKWCIGYFYSNKKGDFFIGFTPKFKDNIKLFALCIAEKCNNINLGDDRKETPFLFNDGWYYYPITEELKELNIDNLLETDKKFINIEILKDIQKKVESKKIELSQIRKICETIKN